VFNVGPFEMVVLAAVALIVFGPDKLPQLAKDAARMLRTLRDLAQGARTQLNDELGPGFADFDLRSLNPRTALKNALLGDEDFSGLNPNQFNPGQFNPREAFKKLMDDEPPASTGPTLQKPDLSKPYLSKQEPAAPITSVDVVPSEPTQPTRWDTDAT
jgi:sec-independent protein translocase protein TatB